MTQKVYAGLVTFLMGCVSKCILNGRKAKKVEEKKKEIIADSIVTLYIFFISFYLTFLDCI